jgi:hypothetical protein
LPDCIVDQPIGISSFAALCSFAFYILLLHLYWAFFEAAFLEQRFRLLHGVFKMGLGSGLAQIAILALFRTNGSGKSELERISFCIWAACFFFNRRISLDGAYGTTGLQKLPFFSACTVQIGYCSSDITS